MKGNECNRPRGSFGISFRAAADILVRPFPIIGKKRASRQFSINLKDHTG